MEARRRPAPAPCLYHLPDLAGDDQDEQQDRGGIDEQERDEDGIQIARQGDALNGRWFLVEKNRVQFLADILFVGAASRSSAGMPSRRAVGWTA